MKSRRRLAADNLAGVSDPVILATQQNDASFDERLGRARLARPRARLHRPGRAARAARGRADHVLLRLRPDRAEPAPRQPRAAADSCAGCSSPGTSRSGSSAARPGSSAIRGRPPSARSTPRRPSPSGSATSAAQVERFLELRGRERRAHGQQPRLDRAAQRDRLPARHRQALPRRHDAQEGRGRARLNSDAGISYTEFSYQILQGLDYLELYRQYGCVLQTGGSDQWGNLTSGVDLIHRVEGSSVHAIGTPLITNSDGTKFGKSEGNAIWLDAAMCSPYRDVPVLAQHRRRRRRSTGSRSSRSSRAREIEELAAARRDASRSGATAQKRLALEVTTLVHGADAAAAVDRGIRGAVRAGRSDGARRRHARSRRCASCRTRRRRRMPRRAGARRHGPRGEPERGRAARSRRAASRSTACASTTSPRPSTGTLPRGGMAVLRRGKKTLAGIFVE